MISKDGVHSRTSPLDRWFARVQTARTRTSLTSSNAMHSKQ